MLPLTQRAETARYNPPAGRVTSISIRPFLAQIVARATKHKQNGMSRTEPPLRSTTSRSCFYWANVWTLFILASSGAESSTRPELSHTNLLFYCTKEGTVAPVRSKAEWKRRRAEILEGMQAVMGPLPGKQKRCSLDVRIKEELDEGVFVRRFITYSSEFGSRVPAWLLLPKTALDSHRKFPGVLALHPTDMEHGHRVVVEPLRTQYPAYARELAERGFGVLAPGYPL